MSSSFESAENGARALQALYFNAHTPGLAQRALWVSSWAAEMHVVSSLGSKEGLRGCGPGGLPPPPTPPRSLLLCLCCK